MAFASQAKRWLLLLSLLLGFGVASPAQQAAFDAKREGQQRSTSQPDSVAGTVVVLEVGARVPVEGIAVSLAPETTEQGQPVSAVSAKTDSEGRFTFTNVSPGAYVLSVTSEGFKPVNLHIRVARNSVLPDQEILLQPATVVSSVKVEAQTQELQVQNAEAQTATFTPEQVFSLPSERQTVAETLPRFPSVIRTNDARLKLKGFDESQGLLLINGAQMVDPVTGSFSVPVPADSVSSIGLVTKAESAWYAGFADGLTQIETKSPPNTFKVNVQNFLPDIRGVNGTMVGIAKAIPRLSFAVPIKKDRFYFSEAFEWQVWKQPVRGLAWPHDDTIDEGYTSYSTFQYIFSPRHVLSENVDVFSLRNQFANITPLLPQPASSDLGQNGYSLGTIDDYGFAGGTSLRTILQITGIDDRARGQGFADMLLTPEAWGGNYFNRWSRNSRKIEFLELFRLPQKEAFGKHQLSAGFDFVHRNFQGKTLSQTVQVLREDGSLAESVSFNGPGGLSAGDSSGALFVQDLWQLNSRVSLASGLRVAWESLSQSFNAGPRAELSFKPFASERTILHAGVTESHSIAPLLAGDFAGNPARTVQQFDPTGVPLGPAITYVPAYVSNSAAPVFPAPSTHLSAVPANLTWSAGLDHQVAQNAILRFNYSESQVRNDLIVNLLPTPQPGTDLLALSNQGSFRVKQFETTLRWKMRTIDEWNVSYVWTRAKGDLNTLSNLYVPFEEPIIRPNRYAALATDIPTRVVVWGIVRVPLKIQISPVIEFHTGFPYSAVDEYQQYVGIPNGHRLPDYFSLDYKVTREFPIRVPFKEGAKTHHIRFGIYSLNGTNHGNYSTVYNNITSPLAGQYTGFLRRVTGLVLDFVN